MGLYSGKHVQQSDMNFHTLLLLSPVSEPVLALLRRKKPPKKKIEDVPAVVKERAMDLPMSGRQLLLLSITMSFCPMMYNNGFRRVRFRMILRDGMIRLAGHCCLIRCSRRSYCA